MLCKSCNTDMFVAGQEYTTTGDNSPDTETKMFTVPCFICCNKMCVREGQIVRGEPIPLENKVNQTIKLRKDGD